jgi:hypothetical protein
MPVVSAPAASQPAVPGISVRERLRATAGLGVVYALLVVVAAGYIAAFAITGFLRAIFPFPLDGLEGGALQEVARIRAGLPIYVAPTLDYVPFIYGPLYYWAAALVAMVVRSDLLALRLVSLLASLGSIGLVATLVKRETGSWAMGVVGGAMLAVCDPFVDGAMDLGRVDALSVFLLLAAILAARISALDGTSTWRSSAASGVLLGLALLTKQSVAPVVLALVVVVALSRWRRAPALVLATAVTFGLGLLLVSLPTWPWSRFFLWELPRAHQVTREFVTIFWSDFVTHVPVAALVGPLYLVGRALVGDRPRLLFYVAVTAGMFAMAWITRSTVGAARNVELPAYAATALLFGLGVHEALAQIGTATERARLMRAYVGAALIGAFVFLVYNPRPWVPLRSTIWADERLAGTLAELPGPIFAGGYQGFVGGAAAAIAPDLSAVNEMQGERVRPGTAEGERWSDDFVSELHAGRITYVIVNPDDPVASVEVAILTKDYGYVNIGSLFPEGDKYWQWRTAGGSPKVEVWARPDLAREKLPPPVGGPA